VVGWHSRGDAARNVLGNRQALVRIALARDLDQIFVAGDETEGGGVGEDARQVMRSPNHRGGLVLPNTYAA
jgi:hypothetical protein